MTAVHVIACYQYSLSMVSLVFCGLQLQYNCKNSQLSRVNLKSAFKNVLFASVLFDFDSVPSWDIEDVSLTT